MATKNIPTIVSTLSDRNLSTTRVVDLGDSVLIIGTSARGPVNQPIQVFSPADAADIYGPQTTGNLVRGFNEVYYGPNGVKDIRMCRISNGKKAVLELEEKLGTLEENESYSGLDQIVAMVIQANDPGDIYNQCTFRQDIVDGYLAVIGYNPVTGLETVIPYDPLEQRTGSVSDVVGLADAINVDPNLGGIVRATANEINTGYELFLDSSMVGTGLAGELTGTTLVLDLGVALDDADPNDDGFTEDENLITPSGVPVTAANRIIKLNEVYELADLEEELDTAGLAVSTLTYPVQLNGGVPEAFINLDLTPGTGGEAKHKVVSSYIGRGDGTTVEFQFTAYEAIDSATFKLYRTSAAGTTVEVTAGNFTLDSVGGSGNDYIAQITFTSAPIDGSILTVTYDSEIFELTQSASITAAKASNSYRTYFVAGNKVTWGTAQPADIVIAYKAKKIYEVGSDVVVYNAKEGQIQFSNPDNQPEYANASGTWIGFDYDYQPEWVNLGSGARALKGGSNGVEMNNTAKYDVLTETYKAIADYSVDKILLMEIYVDDTKIIYDDETGLPVTVNAGFAAQFEAFLLELQDGVNETSGIMAVLPSESSRIEDVQDWFTKLTVTSTSDLTRSANVMAGLDAKHIDIVAFEPVIANNSVSVPYTTTGEAIYAGMTCKLPITSGPTNKTLGTQVVTCRYKLSTRQLDTLSGLRYVTTKLTPEGVWVITDGVTAAAIGSDYTRWTTRNITFKSMDVVRSAGRPFLGDLFNPVKRAALETAIQKGLLSLQERGALRKFDFAIEQTAEERALGIARIPLVLWPEFELRRIEVEVKLSNA